MADKKWSSFPSATPDNADEVVGLHAGDNARFSVSNFILAIRQGLANLFVPLARTINNKALSADITLDASDVSAVDASDVGVAGGVAELDSNGKVPISQLPTIPDSADEISYDNTTSGLTATDVQDAIDELAQSGGGGTAASISYDNTGSGLSATDVQDAIDELAAGGGGGGSSTLAGLTDTSISSPSTGQILEYNGSSAKWENAQKPGWVSAIPGGGYDTRATWTQDPGEISFFLCYWNAYELWVVFVGRDNSRASAKLSSSGFIGSSPSFSYDSSTHTVTATWGSANYAKLLKL